jgi:hypothetical protein
MGRVIGPGAVLLTGATDLIFRKRELVGAWNVVTALDRTGPSWAAMPRPTSCPLANICPCARCSPRSASRGWSPGRPTTGPAPARARSISVHTGWARSASRSATKSSSRPCGRPRASPRFPVHAFQ